MKKGEIISGLFFVAILSICWTTAHQYKTSSLCDAPLIGGHTGAPGETSCTGCHAGTANTGPGILSFDLGGVTQYTPSQTYTGTVKLSQIGINKFGFVSVALRNNNNTTAGTFTLIDTARTRLFSDEGRNYVGHTPCGADANPADYTQWQFQWTAPSTNIGDVTLYLGSIATNHNHATTGDNTYTASIVLTPSSNSVNEISDVLTELNIYPNPVFDHLTVAFKTYYTDVVGIELFDINGRKVELLKPELTQKGTTTKSIDIKGKGVKPGTYLIKIVIGDKSISKHISVI